MRIRITKNGVSQVLERELQALPRLVAKGYAVEVVVPVVLEGTGPTEAEAQTSAALIQTDLAIGRVVEDLFDALKAKGVLADADLPEEARKKIAARDALREAVK